MPLTSDRFLRLIDAADSLISAYEARRSEVLGVIRLQDSQLKAAIQRLPADLTSNTQVRETLDELLQGWSILAGLTRDAIPLPAEALKVLVEEKTIFNINAKRNASSRIAMRRLRRERQLAEGYEADMDRRTIEGRQLAAQLAVEGYVRTGRATASPEPQPEDRWLPPTDPSTWQELIPPADLAPKDVTPEGLERWARARFADIQHERHVETKSAPEPEAEEADPRAEYERERAERQKADAERYANRQAALERGEHVSLLSRQPTAEDAEDASA
jgi:hypothetical protein